MYDHKLGSPASTIRRRCSSGSSERPERCQWSPLRTKGVSLSQGAPLASLWPLRAPTCRRSFFFSGLQWHLSGLSDLPLEQRLLVSLASERFPFFLEEEPSFLFFFAVVGFLYMYDHVVEHLPQAQHSAVRPAQCSEPSTCRSEHYNASRQSRREPVCRRAFFQPAAFSNRTKKSKSARPTKKHTATHKAG